MISELFVIDCSTVLAGPSVGTFFAESGAKVLKIENKNVPDVTRSWKLPSEDSSRSISAYFSSVNYKKEYKPLDFKDEVDMKLLFTYLSQADIFISNFKKGDAEKFGITDDVLLTLNPRLIIGKISGFGEESDRVAYDLILQAETGYMSMNGTPISGPVKMPVALVDVLAANQLKVGLLTALLNREKTGKGSIVTVSLFDAAVSALVNQASNYLMGGHIPARIGSLHPNIAPYGEIFATKDAKQITFAVGSNKHFNLLCNYFGVPELISNSKFSENKQRVENRKELFEVLQKLVVQYTADEICENLNKLFVPVGVIKNLNEVFSDVNAKKLVREELIDGQITKRVSQVAFQIQNSWK